MNTKQINEIEIEDADVNRLLDILGKAWRSEASTHEEYDLMVKLIKKSATEIAETAFQMGREFEKNSA